MAGKVCNKQRMNGINMDGDMVNSSLIGFLGIFCVWICQGWGVPTASSSQCQQLKPKDVETTLIAICFSTESMELEVVTFP